MHFLDKLKHKMAEAADAAAALIPDLPLADDSDRAARMEICKGCEHLFPLTNQCKQCGCFLYSKTYLASSTCPIGKWGAVVPKTAL